MPSYTREELAQEITDLVSVKGWRLKSLPALEALRSAQPVVDRLKAGFTDDDAVIEALRWAAARLESTEWQVTASLYLGLTDDTKGLAKTTRAELAAAYQNMDPSTFLRPRSAWQNRTGPDKVISDVAAVLTRPRPLHGPAIFAPDPPMPGAMDHGWGWSDGEPPRQAFRQWDSQGGLGQFDSTKESWQVVWSRSYLAIDEADSRRQHYLWTIKLRSLANGLVSYPKPFGWTGSGEHEQLLVHTPQVEWHGSHLAANRADQSQWSYQLFHLGRVYDAGEELVLQYSETWFDRHYFFHPFLRVQSVNAGQEHLEVGVRLPTAMRPSSFAEMHWPPSDADREESATPRRVREFDYVAGTWYGIHVPHPMHGHSYGLKWSSGVYDGYPAGG